MEITFLGTSSMVPTKDRNQIAVFLSYNTHGILFDCGEGTQRQFKLANIPLPKVTKILLTHWHGDHVLGLPGLMQTLSSLNYSSKLEIYGPKGTKKRIEKMFEAFIFDKKLDFEVVEITKDGKFSENAEFSLEAYKVEHGIETLCFRLVEKDRRKIDMKKAKKLGIPEGPLIGKLQQGHPIDIKGKKISPDDVSTIQPGKRLAYVTDTIPCDGCYRAAQDADLLICEATYSSKLSEKSEEYNHMTARQAAHIASNSGAKKLALVHFSARYKSTAEIEEDAKNLFDNTVCAYDLMKINL